MKEGGKDSGATAVTHEAGFAIEPSSPARGYPTCVGNNYQAWTETPYGSVHPHARGILGIAQPVHLVVRFTPTRVGNTSICPFCKQAKGEIRKIRGGFQGVCRNCGAPFELFHLSISPPNSVAAALSERWCRVDQLVRSPADHHDHRQWYGKWPIPIPCR
jgi:hypothetical protein